MLILSFVTRTFWGVQPVGFCDRFDIRSFLPAVPVRFGARRWRPQVVAAVGAGAGGKASATGSSAAGPGVASAVGAATGSPRAVAAASGSIPSGNSTLPIGWVGAFSALGENCGAAAVGFLVQSRPQSGQPEQTFRSVWFLSSTSCPDGAPLTMQLREAAVCTEAIKSSSSNPLSNVFSARTPSFACVACVAPVHGNGSSAWKQQFRDPFSGDV